MRKHINKGESRKLNKSEISAKKNLLKNHQKIKETGFIKYYLKQSCSIFLGLFIAGILLKKSILYLILLLPFTFIFTLIETLVLWSKLDEKVKTLKDELDNGWGIIIPLSKRVRFYAGLIVLLLLLKPALWIFNNNIYDISNVFLIGRDRVEITTNQSGDKLLKIRIPIEFVGSKIEVRDIDIYPMSKPRNGVFIMASYPNFEKLVIEGELLKVMKSMSNLNGMRSKYTISDTLRTL